jgi:hypothetical protein
MLFCIQLGEIMRSLLIVVLAALVSLSAMSAAPALAADAATVIFKSGQVVRIADGFRQIIDAMRGLKDEKHKVVELNIGGGSFLLDVAQAVIVCRDNCSSLTVLHQLDPRRSIPESEQGSKS